MPTARELLEQADALMKRNRALGEDAEIPELTDVVPESELGTTAPVAADDAWQTGGTLDASGTEPLPESPTLQGEPSVWLDDTAFGEASVTGRPPDSVMMVPAPAAPLVPAPAAASPRDERVAALPADAPPATLEADLARWEALADEIRMQVLQRIDLFTDTGLKSQLMERLQPAVDRASAELVGTLSAEVGQLLRAYVAEAIEREIERWRKGSGTT